jgi:hypothetical protein
MVGTVLGTGNTAGREYDRDLHLKFIRTDYSAVRNLTLLAYSVNASQGGWSRPSF